jgi:uncharacterized protein (TIGR03435 family)
MKGVVASCLAALAVPIAMGAAAARRAGIRSGLVELLSDRIGRTVVDKTGFRGAFDFQLDFAPEEAMGSHPGTAPSIFAALQEQLGMRLESAKGPVEVLVINRVARPSEN